MALRPQWHWTPPASAVLTKGWLWGIYASVGSQRRYYIINGDGGDFIQGDGILKPRFYETLEETLNGNDVLDGGDDNATIPFAGWICAMSKQNQSQNHWVTRAYN